MHFEKLLHFFASALDPMISTHDAINICANNLVAVNFLFMISPTNVQKIHL